jgi:hypothetical protein
VRQILGQENSFSDYQYALQSIHGEGQGASALKRAVHRQAHLRPKSIIYVISGDLPF